MSVILRPMGTSGHLGIMCPSTDLTESTHVLGIKGKDGQLRMLSSLLPLPPVALEQLTRDDLRNSVRLTGRCIKGGCHHWVGHCRLGEEVSVLANSSDGEAISCSISTHCRWRLENGDSVCRVCPQVMREKFVEEIAKEINGRETKP